MNIKNSEKTNIVLIGMPGAGKSTVGVILAKRLALDFLDTDLLIQAGEGRPLQDILDELGYMTLRNIEERVLLSLDCGHCVISTGGSAAYSQSAMAHLGKNGVIVFLHVVFDEIVRRVRNFDTRGIARSPDQSFKDLYEERQALYKRYADITINCETMNQEEVLDAVCVRLAEISD